MNDTYYAKEKLLSEGYTCVLCSGSTVHTSTLRGVKPLVQWLESGIEVQYGTLVENIINRKGDGICPFEEAVLEIHNAAEAYPAILRKMKEMNILVSEPAS